MCSKTRPPLITWQWNTPIYTCLSHLNPNLQGDFHHLHGVSHSFPISYRDFPASHVFLIWVFSVAAQLHYTGSAESPRPTTHAQLAIPGPMGLQKSNWWNGVPKCILKNIHIYIYIYLSIYPSIHLSVYQSINLSICLSIYLTNYLS